MKDLESRYSSPILESTRKSHKARCFFISAAIGLAALASVKLGVVNIDNLSNKIGYYRASKYGIWDYSVCQNGKNEIIYLADRPDIKLLVGEAVLQGGTWNQWIENNFPSIKKGTALRLSFAVDDYLGPFIPATAKQPVRKAPIELLTGNQPLENCVEMSYRR